MRIALVEIIGHLIREIALADDEVDAQLARKQLNGLYELLMERVMDISSDRTKQNKTMNIHKNHTVTIDT